jgi:hypothetical protein
VAKKFALKRDGYRCVVSGFIDLAADELTPAELQEYNLVGDNFVGHFPTNFCPIFSPSTNWNLKPEEHGHPKTKYSGNVWGIINGVGSFDVLSKLNGADIHNLSNGLTLASGYHDLFDKLSLWFEPVPDTPNTYNITSVNKVYCLRNPVTFTTTTKPRTTQIRIPRASCNCLSGCPFVRCC